MFLAKVVGTVWASVKWEKLEGLRLLIVKPYDYADLKQFNLAPAEFDGVVVADVLGAGIGEDVICAYGHAGRVGLEVLSEGQKPSKPVDAAIVAIVDRFEFSEPS